MKTLLLFLSLAIVLSGCQSPYAGNPKAYKRAHDRYMDNYEPGVGSDL